MSKFTGHMANAVVLSSPVVGQDFVWKVVHYADIARTTPRSYLSERELQVLENKDEHKRLGWLASRYALKEAVREFFPDRQPWEIAVIHEMNGKPVLPGMEGVSISLSHSGCYGAAAVTRRGRAGVDIERVRSFREEMLRAFLTEEEFGRVMAAEGQERDVLATGYWAGKEAYLKALGLGLRRHPQTISIADLRVRWISTEDYVTALSCMC